MKYFVEKSDCDFGSSQYLEVSEEYGNSSLAHEINIVSGRHTFHLYLMPWNVGHLLCVWMDMDSQLNFNHWDVVLGVPERISPNEFLKSKAVMTKPFPNYIYAYERGAKEDFSAPALYRMEDPAQDGAKKWCMCKISNWSSGANDELLSECNNLLRYVIEMYNQLRNNEIDWKDRAINNIKEGVKDGVKAYIKSLIGDIYSDIDWSDIVENYPN